MSPVSKSELDAVARREPHQPHAVLGAHPGKNGSVTVRVLRPAAEKVSVKPAKGKTVELKKVHPAGIFEGSIPDQTLPMRYRVKIDYGDGGKFTIDDPYAFEPTLGELDLYLMGEGRHEELYNKLGAHPRTHQNVARAPLSPSGRRPRGRSRSSGTSTPGTAGCTRCGRWARAGSGSCSCPASGRASATSTRSSRADGEVLLKADPYAQETEVPPKTASVVFEPSHRWSEADAAYLSARAETQPLTGPMSIYEVHLGSWRLNSLQDNRSLSYASSPTSCRRTRSTSASRTSSCCR